MQSFWSIYCSVSMHVYYTCHCIDLSRPLFLFRLACAENILWICVPCQSNRGKSLFLSLDLPSFPLVFFVCFSSEALLRCTLRAVVGGTVRHVLWCIAGFLLSEWVRHGQDTVTCCGSTYQKLLQVTFFPSTAWSWVTPRNLVQNMLAQDLDFLCWACFSTRYCRWWQRLPEILEPDSDTTALLLRSLSTRCGRTYPNLLSTRLHLCLQSV